MLEIVKDPHPILRARAEAVSFPLAEQDEKLALKMLEYIVKSQDAEYAEEHNIRSGVGLAAPQVGESKRIVVIHLPLTDEETKTHVLINPQIKRASVKRAYLKAGEGCLSVDEYIEGHVYRHAEVTVSGYDVLQKKNVEIIADGLEAIVLQHEIDHLNGIMFYDRIDDNNEIKYPDADIL